LTASSDRSFGRFEEGVGIAKIGPPSDPFNVRVRATVHGSELGHTGTVIYLSADSLLMNSDDDGRRLAIPVPDIAKLEVWRYYMEPGLRDDEEGAIVGALIGFFLGGFAAGVSAPLAAAPPIGPWAAYGAAGGAAIGADMAGGAAAGGATLQWVEVSVRMLRQELCNCWIQKAATS
jgi:hypothetical protein